MGSSIKLPGGLKLNLGKKGVGASFNKKGFGVGIGPNGGRVKASIPGTGISWSESIPLNKLKKLKEAFFSKENKKEDDVIIDAICAMCGEELNLETNIQKQIFKETGLCEKCYKEF
jgi:hypothetical protein